MARTCGKCRRVLRYDESLSAFDVIGWGNGHVCEVCIANATGQPVPESMRYPPGCHLPKMPNGQTDIPICGLCRKALPEDQEAGKPLHVRREFFGTREEVAEYQSLEAGTDDAEIRADWRACRGWPVEPGIYSACRECIAKWRPSMLAYLKGEGLLPEMATERQVAGGWLQ